MDCRRCRRGIIEQVAERFPAHIEAATLAADNPVELSQLGYRASDVQSALLLSEQALSYYRKNGGFDSYSTGNSLRSILETGLQQEEELIQEAHSLLRPADNYGGRMSFLWVAPIAFAVGIIFLIVYINDRRKGGYKIECLEGEG